MKERLPQVKNYVGTVRLILAKLVYIGYVLINTKSIIEDKIYKNQVTDILLNM